MLEALEGAMLEGLFHVEQKPTDFCGF